MSSNYKADVDIQSRLTISFAVDIFYIPVNITQLHEKRFD